MPVRAMIPSLLVACGALLLVACGERGIDFGSRQGERPQPVDLVLDADGLPDPAVLADEQASVVNLSSRTDRRSMQTVMDISVEIRDLPTLSTAITRLEQLPNVIAVNRKA